MLLEGFAGIYEQLSFQILTNILALFTTVRELPLFKHTLNTQDVSNLRILVQSVQGLKKKKKAIREDLHFYSLVLGYRHFAIMASISGADDKNCQLTTVSDLYPFLTRISL